MLLCCIEHHFKPFYKFIIAEFEFNEAEIAFIIVVYHAFCMVSEKYYNEPYDLNECIIVLYSSMNCVHLCVCMSFLHASNVDASHWREKKTSSN